MIIGITGGSGSGKTTLLALLQQQGTLILDCDAIYHRLLESDKFLLQEIEDRFCGSVKNGILDRKALGSIVFSDKNALQDLNRITHAAVKKEVLALLESNPPLAAIDAIGLFEGGLAPLCHITVAVTAPKDMRIRRLMAREGISESYARRRIAAQHTDAWFSRRCHYTLENNTTPEAFRDKCLAFFREVGIMK